MCQLITSPSTITSIGNVFGHRMGASGPFPAMVSVQQCTEKHSETLVPDTRPVLPMLPGTMGITALAWHSKGRGDKPF